MANMSERIPAIPRPKLSMRVRNIALSLLLRSPFHKRVSQTILLLAFRGRKSDKSYSFPVGYIRKSEKDLIVLTPEKRSWWKNFRDAAPVTVYIQGQKRQGIAQTIRDDREEIAQGITAFLRMNPNAAPMYRVELDSSGEPTPETLQQATFHWIVVSIHLTL